jgi:hypothetical protein
MGMPGRLRKEALPKRRSQIGDAFVRADARISHRQRAINFEARIHTAIALRSTPVPASCRHTRKVAILAASAAQSP